MPAATALAPSCTNARARTVAVVVPSPADFSVCFAASRDEPGADVLHPVLELDLLGDGHAVLGDAPVTAGRLIDHRAALGAEGDRNGVGEDVDAFEKARAGLLGLMDLLLGHRRSLQIGCLTREGALLLDHAHDVGLLHDQQLLAVDLDLGA